MIIKAIYGDMNSVMTALPKLRIASMLNVMATGTTTLEKMPKMSTQVFSEQKSQHSQQRQHTVDLQIICLVQQS